MSCIKCIICGKQAKSSIEHIIPDSLGGTIIIKEVCKDCNEKLGSLIDCHLIMNFSNTQYRNDYHIDGKTEKIPKRINCTMTSSGRSLIIVQYPNEEPIIVSG